MAELILSLRERELSRFAIARMRTTIGRDPSCDVVIDNVGVSRLHASIEVIGDSFVLRDCQSQNGLTLNGEPCREGRLVHGDMIGLNKFLIRFSNHSLEVPNNLEPVQQRAEAEGPKEVQRTMHLDASSAQALAERAKEMIARRRAELAARDGESLPPLQTSERAAPRNSLRWEEPEQSSRHQLAMLLGAVVVGGALIAGLISFVF